MLNHIENRNLNWKTTLKRGLAMLLMVTMTATFMPEQAYAEESSEQTPSYTIKVNGTDASENPSVTYGTSVSPELSGYSGDGTLTWYYKKDGDWSTGIPSEPGTYYISVEVSESGTNSSYGDDGNNRFTISKAALSAPSGLSWNSGSTASWSSVDHAGSYQVTLYKDDSEEGSQTVSGTTCDYTDTMKSAAGVYTFSVTAVPEQADHYDNSAASDRSAAAYAVAVTAQPGAGISSAAVAEGSPSVLIPGNTGCNSTTVTAAVAEGYSFSQWSSDASVTLDAPSAAQTTVTLPDGYASASLTVSAAAADTTAPSITFFTAGIKADQQYGQLIGKAQDTGSGITAYAFDQTQAASESTAWTTIAAETGEMTQALTPDAGGGWYFHVKDASGNMTSSTDAVHVTKITYHDYYTNGAKDDAHTAYLVGSAEGVTLDTTARAAFDFGGWYLAADCSGSAVTEIAANAHRDGGIDVYAKWTRQEAKISTQPVGITKTYDGSEYTMTAGVSNTEGAVSWQWYKDGTKIDGAAASSFTVRNVADSGSYYVKVTITAATDATEKTATSTAVTVSITKAELQIRAKDKEITYGDAAPSYELKTAEGYGLKGSDTLSGILTGGSITCAYKTGDSKNTYPITLSGYTADNYTVAMTDGTLTVKAKDLEKDNSVEVAFKDQASAEMILTYTGSALTPEVTVQMSEAAMDASSYQVTYADNTNVGTATVTVTFTGNYSGSRTLTFAITKAVFTPVVSIADWTYGETASEPSLSTNPGSGTPTYYYYQEDAAKATTSRPSDAGTYHIYVEIPETDNYGSVTTKGSPVQFQIKPRIITITAASEWWYFSGNTYSDSDYTMQGTFAGTDSFQNVTVTGSITNAGTQANVITYTLSSSTKASNYQINTTDGTLTVYARSLSSPSDCKFSASEPGTATWVAVSKKNLTVSYTATLYSVRNSVYQLIKTKSDITGTSYNFADDIRNDTKTNGAAGYSFCVKSISAGGDNRANYEDSSDSGDSAVIYTVAATITADAGIAGMTMTGNAFTSGGTLYLIQGESYDAVATLNTGYSFASTVWEEHLDSGETSALVFGKATAGTTTIRTGTLTAGVSRTIYVHSNDDKPVISSCTASLNEARNAVTLSLAASDSRALTGWAVMTTAGQPAADAADTWTTINNLTSVEVTRQITSKGTYYVWIKDNSGNVVGADPISIYQLNFAAGTGPKGAAATGTMNSILKIQNQTIPLPENAFACTGYSFKSWSGTTGMYVNKGNYAANADDTLTAQWTDEQYSYTVNYYLMGTDGTYPGQVSETRTCTAAYGAEIRSSDSAVSISKAGMTADTAAEYQKSITVDRDGLTLDVHYKRLSYTITYSYTAPGAATSTTHSDTILYGAAVTEYARPAAEGYKFVGWVYGESGSAPSTMPAYNITATGSFKAEDASYTINYYEENIAADSAPVQYSIDSALTQTISEAHGETVTKTTAQAMAIEGFTIRAVTATSGAAGGTQPGDLSGKTATGTVSKTSQLNINYYYSRNTYSITLNIWKTDRTTEANRLYTQTWSGIQYGSTLTPDTYITDTNKNNWGIAAEKISGYTLADYADWSTGAAPTTMPAGDVTVARDFVTATQAAYKVEVYLENVTAGSYTLSASLNYYDSVGKTVTIGKNDTDTIDYTKLGNAISDGNFAYYEYDTDNVNNVITGTVTDSNKSTVTPLTLAIYFKRKMVSTTISYYYSDGNGTENKLFATWTKEGRWGTTYSVEPVTLFGRTTAYTPEAGNGTLTYQDNVTIGGTAASAYDFKTDGYVASYSSYYYLDGSGHWPGCSRITDLSAAYTSTFGTGSNNTATVYYTKPDQQKNHYFVDVVYNESGLNKKTDSDNHPVTVSIGGTTYNVRIANKSDLFETTYTTGSGHENYPGLNAVTGTYMYGALKAGFTEISYTTTADDGTGTTGTYYTNTENGTNYLYIIDNDGQGNPREQFYYGNYTGIGFNIAKWPGGDTVRGILKDYISGHSDSSHTDTYDEKAAAAQIYNTSFSGIRYSGNGTLTISFTYKATYRITYNLGGTLQYSPYYVTGTTVTDDEISGFQKNFTTKAGYEINWYTDTSFTTKVASFQITSNRVFYGRYERSTKLCHEYIYYELPQSLTVGTDTVDYVTADQLTAFQNAYSGSVTSQTSSKTITYTDGAGVTTAAYSVPVTTWYYTADGVSNVIMVDKEYPCLTYSELDLDGGYNAAEYQKTGFRYDDTNTDNTTYRYCETEAVSLAAYYARNRHTQTLVPANARNSTSVITTWRYGQTVTDAAVTKTGYTFHTWAWQKQNAENLTWSDWTDSAPVAVTGGSVTYQMPDCNVMVTATWTPATYETGITHYFQNVSQNYDTALLTKLQGMTGTSASITGFLTGSGTVYTESGKVIGASVAKAAGQTVYFSAAAASEGSYTVDATDLIAEVDQVTLTSEQQVKVSDYALKSTDYSMFSYSFTRYQSDTVTQLDAAGSFTCDPEAVVSYYYTRTSDITIQAVSRSTDNGTAGATIVGTGNCYYGESVTLTANVAAGYEFKGWYHAADVLDGYAQDGTKELSAYSLKSIAGCTAYSTDPHPTLTMTKSLVLVAVTEPKAVAGATVTVSGKNAYTYGYTATADNTLAASVTVDAGADSANYISAYQWYQRETVNGIAEDTKLEGADSVTYIFPTGKEYGTYSYVCQITMSRKDNGRSQQIMSAPYSVTVSPAGVEASVASYSGTYDGKAHGITVSVTKPGSGTTVYYSTSQALTAVNYTSGVTVNPVWTNVETGIDSQPVIHTVYYYVESGTSNYSGFSGSGTVEIKPITLSVKGTDRAFSWVYTGSEEVTGSVTSGSGTAKYALAHGSYYTVGGLLTGESGSYQLDFNAAFNSRHVSASSTVTLKDMRVIDAEGSVNPDYVFPAGYSLTISGYVFPKDIELTWYGNSFIYDGQAHAPTVGLTSGTTTPDTVKLAVGGAQTSAGSYTATAGIDDSGQTAYEAGDYGISYTERSCAYTISKRAVTITPVQKAAITYDGQSHQLTEYQIDQNTSGTMTIAATGHTVTVDPTQGCTAAGTYQVTAPENGVRIYDSQNKRVEDNYEITRASASLVIGTKTVTVDGIKAQNKTYDGQSAAELDLSAVGFNGIVDGDTLTLDSAKVTGTFADASAGTGKTVTISCQDGALSGASAANYTLNTAASQQTASADITGAVITVTPQSVTTTYGESAAFTSVYSGAISGEDYGSLITGAVTYKVYASGSSAGTAVPYTVQTAAGSYGIVPDISALKAANYSFKLADGTATLAVQKKSVSVSAAASPTVTKVYDGTTAAYDMTGKIAAVSADDYVFSGIVNNDNISLTKFTAVYDSKDATVKDMNGGVTGGATRVTMSSMEIGNSNYQLVTSSFDIPGAVITPKALTITAEDKSITYGDAAPVYTAVWNGLVTGDSSSTLNYGCDYSISEATKRSAGAYTITVAGYTNSNYSISYVRGTLNVSKAELKVKAGDVSKKFADVFPAYTYTYDTSAPFKYNDSASVVTGTVTYTDTAHNTDQTSKGKGTYSITPVVTGLSADNYGFTPVNGTLTITTSELTIDGITIDNKVYDGTVNATGSINRSQMTCKLAGGQVVTPAAGDVKITAAYADKNVGSKAVTLVISLSGTTAEQYSLAANSQTGATGTITAKPLGITAKVSDISYGQKPLISASYDAFVSGESAGNAADVLTYKITEGNTDYTGTTYLPVGTYTVTPSAYANNNSSNYSVSYTACTFKVSQKQLGAPQPVWSSSAPGTVTWTAPAAIGEVSPAEYSVSLFKDGATSTVSTQTVKSGGALQYDFADTIRTNGAGYYTVKVTAIPQTENNSNKANVTDSSAGTTKSLYAALVTPQFAEDTVSQAAKSQQAAPVTIKGQSEYVMISGEQNISLSAQLINSTGYTPSAWTSSSSALTMTAPSKEASASTVTATCTMGELTSSAPITATLSLSSVKATLSATVAADKASVDYGYTQEQAPVLTATAAVESGDNITTEGYRYTYQWQMTAGHGTLTDVAGGTEQKCSIPLQLNAGTNYYKYYCTVTATRRDNGEQKTVTVPKSPNGLIVNINKATFSTGVTMTGWTYGEKRNEPSLQAQPPETTTVTYQYSADGTDWSATVPTDAGTYYVRAVIAASANYAAFTTPAVSYTISKAQLEVPANLYLAGDQYGTATWNTVSGPVENAGATGATAVGVTYTVKLYHAENASSESWTLAGTYTGNDITVSGGVASCNVSNGLTDIGSYKFTVQADSGDTKNCADSAESTRQGSLDISASVSAGDAGYSKVYDGTPIVLSVNYSGTGVTYQWYKDQQAISGATSATYNVTCAEQNGSYMCALVDNSVSKQSTSRTVTINPRPITVTSPDATKVYDAQALTAQTHAVTNLAAADSLSCTTAAAITDAGETVNTIADIVIKNGDKVVYNTAAGSAAEIGEGKNYTVTVTPGKLTVTPKSLGTGTAYTQGMSVTQPAEVTYDGQEQKPAITITDSTLSRTLTENTDYTLTYGGNVHAGTATITITGIKNYAGSISRTFRINPRPITVASETKSYGYDGKVHQSSGITALQLTDSTTLAKGDTLSAVSFTNTITAAGGITNAYTGLVIKNASGADVTGDYKLTPVYGTLTVTQAEDTLTITGDISKTYDAVPVGTPAFTRKGTGEIQAAYYTKADNAESYTKLDSAPVHAGTYYVQLSETNAGNYKEAVSVYYKFTINPVKITISVADHTSIYLQPLAGLTYTMTGAFVGEENLQIQLATTATDTSKVGAYPITVTYDQKNTDYAVTISGEGTYSITNGTIRVTATEYNGTFDNAGHTAGLTADVSGAKFYYSKDQQLTAANYTDQAVASGQKPSFKQAGSYTIYYYVTAENYNVASGSVKVNISKSNQEVILSDSSFEYDGSAHTVTAAASSLEGQIVYGWYKGDTVSENAKMTSAPVQAGTYTVIASVTGAADYLDAQKQARVTVTQRPLTLTADSASKVYDGQPLQMKSYQTTGGSLANGDTIVSSDMPSVITGAGRQDNMLNQVTIHNAGGTDVTGSYLIGYKPGILTVTKAPGTVQITGTAQTLGKTYDRTAVAAPAVTKSGDGAVTFTWYPVGLSGVPGIALTGAPTAAGNYSVVAHVAEGSNYQAADSAQVGFTISPQQITLTAADTDGAFDAEIPQFTVSTTGGQIFTGDDLQIGAKTSAVKGSPVGIYDIEPTYQSNANYLVTTVKGKYTIKPTDIAFEATGYSGTYDGQSHGISVTGQSDSVIYYGTGTAEVTDSNYTDTAVATTTQPGFVNAGDRTVYYYILTPNHTSVKGSVTVSIQKKAQKLQVQDLEAVYDGMVHSVTAVTDGDGAVSFSAGNGQVLPGTYPVAVTAAGTGNCLAETENVMLSIRKRRLILTAASVSAVYSGSSIASSEYTVSGDGLAPEQKIDKVEVSGVQSSIGTGTNLIQDARIVDRGGNDVTAYYEIEYHDGVLLLQSPPSTASGNTGTGTQNTDTPETEQPSAQAAASVPKKLPGQGSSVPEQQGTQGAGEQPGQEPGSPEDTGNNAAAAGQTGRPADQAGTGTSEQNPEPASAAAQASVAETIDRQTGNPEGVEVKDETVTENSVIPYGNGAIRVLVESAEEDTEKVSYGVVSSQQVIDGCLTEEEKLRVANGDSVDIRVIVSRKTDTGITEDDRQKITEAGDQLGQSVPGLNLGEYLDIQLDKRINGAEWENIAQADQDIEITIDIPDDLQFDGTTYFIIRCHNGECVTLKDLDDDPKTITISTAYFSSYALFYTKSDQETVEDAIIQVQKSSSCMWHVFMIVALAAYVIVQFGIEEERRKRIRWPMFIGFTVMMLVFLILGSCSLDLPFAIASVLIAGISGSARKVLTKKEEQNR